MVIDIHTHTFPDKLAAPTIRKLQGACHTRAFTDATNAGLAASMARAGIESRIPVDQVIDCMGDVGHRMPEEFRETALGDLAATPMGQKVKQQMEERK